ALPIFGMDMPLGERCRKHGEAQLVEPAAFRSLQGMDIARDAAEPAGPGPYARGERGVVIAWDHDPGARKPRERVEEPPHSLVRYRLRVEHVAGDEHRVDAVLLGHRRDAGDGVDAGLGELGGVVGREALVGPAD